MSTTTILRTPTQPALQSSSKVWQAVILVALAYSIAFAIVGSALHISYGFPLDDSYIHQTVARNLAEYGTLGFIPGHTSSGATSVLWTLIQAANYKFIGADPVAYNLAFSWLMLASIGVMLFQLSLRDGMSLSKSIALAISPALCGNFVWLSLIGMEHLFFVALVLGVILCWFDGLQHRQMSAILAGTGAGLVVLARPEALLFGPLIAIAARKAKRKTSEALTVLLIWFLFVAILFAVNRHTSHSFMPATMQGRTWLYFWETGGPHSMRTVLTFLVTWSIRPFMQFSLWYAHPSADPKVLIPAILLPLLAAAFGAISILRQASVRLGLLFLWAFIHFCTYLIEFPAQGHGGRYQPLTLLLMFPCLFFGLLRIFRKVRLPHAMLFAAVLLIAGGALSLRTWRIVTLNGVSHINSTHEKAADWITRNVPTDATIASFDIGRISYDLHRPIVDLGGLVDPAYLPYLMNRRVPEYIRKNRIEYVVLPSTAQFTTGFGFSPELHEMTKLAEFCTAQNTFFITIQYTLAAEQCQLVYRVNE